MSVLFAVSILAFVALLWATISIAGFVRRQRRRRRRRAADAADALLNGAAETRATVSPFSSAESDSAPPPRLRSFPTRLGKQPAADADRPAWNPFSKDLGDLSDPVASRHVPGPRTRKKDIR